MILLIVAPFSDRFSWCLCALSPILSPKIRSVLIYTKLSPCECLCVFCLQGICVHTPGRVLWTACGWIDSVTSALRYLSQRAGLVGSNRDSAPVISR